MPVQDLCRKGGFSDSTFYKWLARFGGMDLPDARRLREMVQENAKRAKPLKTGAKEPPSVNSSERGDTPPADLQRLPAWAASLPCIGPSPAGSACGTRSLAEG